ncbi:MAG TPA: hypothetical protein VEZ12_23705, partial [Herpetosiphonaceae bacterium]|nr:hypothetical protein [Herpetosiphonaceae bacterium]
MDLAPISDPTLVPSAIAQVLAVKESGGQPLLDSLKAYLRHKHVLLVLDNFEQVTSAAPLLAEMLMAAEHLKLLVTSRVTLHLTGEHEVAVPPLALPDPHHLPPLDRLRQYAAVDLFLQRCTAARAEFQVTTATAPAVAAICVRLDGLPLALELAAARIKLFPPDALLQRLDHRLTLLTGGARDKEVRQQTLRNTIDWSYELLTSAEQRLFQRLAVFAGGCTLEAAEAVCNADGDLTIDVLDGLQSLIDQSLVRQEEGVEGEPRFTMLQTIQEYALEQLLAGDEAAATRRFHAEWFVRWAESVAPRLHGPLEVSSVKRLNADDMNLRAAHAWLLAQHEADMAARLGVALWFYYHLADRAADGLRWLDEVLAAMDDRHAVQRARVLPRAADLAWRTDDLVRARAYAEAGVELCTELGDTWGRALGSLVLGHIARSVADTAAAAVAYAESLARFQEVGDAVWIASGQLDLATVALAQRDYTRARSLLEQSQHRFRELGNSGGLALALGLIGEAAHAQGDEAYARRCLDESAALLRARGETGGHAQAFVQAALESWLHGNNERATALLEQAVQQHREA